MASEEAGLSAVVGYGEDPLSAIPSGVGIGSSGDAATCGSGAEAPIMPHNSLSGHDLNRLYPPIWSTR